jgi:F420H(2)-dependent quinone reductase
MPRPPRSTSPLWRGWEAFTRVNVVLFRMTGGRVGGSYRGAPILLLHHTGRRSGRRRVSPLIYLPAGRDLVVVASKGGTDRNPAWFHNLLAAPETDVEVPREGRRRVHARVAEGEERERLWPRVVEIYRPYAGYQRHTDRQIPLVVLAPT